MGSGRWWGFFWPGLVRSPGLPRGLGAAGAAPLPQIMRSSLRPARRCSIPARSQLLLGTWGVSYWKTRGASLAPRSYPPRSGPWILAGVDRGTCAPGGP